ncbi:hypothetical protein EAE96_011182 [Botrytis aclada]|nr:hypothetical protein EAE96_011182 [Botrytis aclada]
MPQPRSVISKPDFSSSGLKEQDQNIEIGPFPLICTIICTHVPVRILQNKTQSFMQYDVAVASLGEGPYCMPQCVFDRVYPHGMGRRADNEHFIPGVTKSVTRKTPTKT